MQDKNTVELTQANRLEWIEPEMRQLDVRETAFRPHGGGDGQVGYPDCARS